MREISARLAFSTAERRVSRLSWRCRMAVFTM
jgi:hypothetical protein